MVGMLKQAMGGDEQQPQEPMANQNPDEQAAAGAGDEMATPEEQEAYERLVLAGMQVLHSDATNPGVMDMLKSGAQNPAQTLADVTFLVMEQIMEQVQGEVDGAVVIPAAAEVLSMTAQLAESAGIFVADEPVLAKALQSLIAKAAEQVGFDPQELESLITELGDQVPGMVDQQSAYAGATGQPGAQPGQQPMAGGV